MQAYQVSLTRTVLHYCNSSILPGTEFCSPQNMIEYHNKAKLEEYRCVLPPGIIQLAHPHNIQLCNFDIDQPVKLFQLVALSKQTPHLNHAETKIVTGQLGKNLSDNFNSCNSMMRTILVAVKFPTRQNKKRLQNVEKYTAISRSVFTEACSLTNFSATKQKFQGKSM